MSLVSTVREAFTSRRRSRTRAGNRRRRSNPALRLNWLTMGGQLEDRLLLSDASLSQWANLPTASWVNGNLGPSKSSYVEGDDIPYRVTFSNLTTGPSNPHTIIIQWDTTKGGVHALDYLTTFDYKTSGPPGVTTTPPTTHVLDGTGLTLATAPENDFPIPVDPNVTAAGVTPVGGQNFELFGPTGTMITSVSGYTL